MNRAALLPLFTIFLILPIFQTTNSSSEVCTVSGQIVSADSGAPLHLAHLVLIEYGHKSKPHVYAALSDESGQFSITGIKPGRYRFMARHNGFITQAYQPAPSSVAGALLDLSPGQDLERVLFRLIPAAAITGKITDEDGEPVAGVKMEALRGPGETADDPDHDDAGATTSDSRSELAPVSEGLTNDLGEYRLYGLTSGNYYVIALDSGQSEADPEIEGNMGEWRKGSESALIYPPTYFPGVFARYEAQKLHVAPGSTVEADMTLRMRKAVKVVGRVLGENGQPAAGAHLLLSSRDAMLSSNETTATADVYGRFTINGVLPGSYLLAAASAQTSPQLSTQMPLEIDEEAPSDVILRLERGGTLRGRVMVAEDTAVSHIDLHSLHVWLSSTESSSFDSGISEVRKNGTFQINDVLRGTYGLRLVGLPSGWYLKSAVLGTTDVLDQGVTISGGTTVLELSLSSKAATLSGTVMIADKPAVGIVVQLVPEHGSSFRPDLPRKALTDQRGRFVIHSIVPARYRVVATFNSGAERSGGAKAEEQLDLGQGDKKTISLVVKE